jgi:4-amino-4-deoxy-L-arabinose transferase-like glycosyltransferase
MSAQHTTERGSAARRALFALGAAGRRLTASRRAVAIALLLIVVAGGAWRAWHAANHNDTGSTDENAYVEAALTIARTGTYGQRDEFLHWPPGAPVMFAIAEKVAPADHPPGERPDIPAAYWAQALVLTLMIPIAFGIAALVAGHGAGLLAALAVAGYPPLAWSAADLLSEPLGTFLASLGFLLLALAAARSGDWSTRRSLLTLAGAGAALGLAVLTRADLILVPFAVAAMVALLVWRAGGPRPGLAAGAAVVAGAVVLIAPWSVNASGEAGEFIPVTKGGGPAFYVGTFLPGDGGTRGLKRICSIDPTFRVGTRDLDHTCQRVGRILNGVASLHPRLPREQAFAAETRVNVRRYLLGEPLEFAGMMGTKLKLMWFTYSRGGARDLDRNIQTFHRVLFGVALAGLLLGLWRTRDPFLVTLLVAALTATAVHMFATSYPRYALPLLPAVLAGGVAGLALWRRPRAGPPDPAPRPS